MWSTTKNNYHPGIEFSRNPVCVPFHTLAKIIRRETFEPPFSILQTQQIVEMIILAGNKSISNGELMVPILMGNISFASHDDDATRNILDERSAQNEILCFAIENRVLKLWAFASGVSKGGPNCPNHSRETLRNDARQRFHIQVVSYANASFSAVFCLFFLSFICHKKRPVQNGL